MSEIKLPTVLIVVTMLCTVATGEAAWDEAFYNPQPLDDDVIVPMPCDGHMVFREIYVPGVGSYADRSITIGSASAGDGFREGLRDTHIAGTFSDANGNGRLFYMGKYEVTRSQYAAMDESCQPVEDGFPIDKVSWFDAIEFAGHYTAWLAEHSPNSLRVLDNAHGFLRLPTESEWEFATRGGVVDPGEFGAKTFPMPDGIEQYVWYSDPQHSGNEVQEIGTLMPNRLGIHDVLGNVSEYVHDAFQLTKLGRLHGQYGGWVVKGGNVRTPSAEIRSSHRQELRPVENNQINHPALVGFRLVLTAPVERSKQNIDKLKQAWRELPDVTEPAEPATLPEQAVDPITEFDQLAKAAPSDEYKQRIERLKQIMLSDIRERNDRRDIAAVSQLRMGAMMGERVRNDHCRMFAMQGNATELQEFLKEVIAADASQAEIDETTALAAESAASAKRQQSATQASLRLYRNLAIELFRSYPSAVLRAQSLVATDELRTSDARAIAPFVKVVRNHALAHSGTEHPTLEMLAEDLVRIRPEGRTCEPPAQQ